MSKYKAAPVMLPPALCEDLEKLKRRLRVLGNKCEHGTTARRLQGYDYDFLAGAITIDACYRFKLYAGMNPFVSSWNRRNAWVTMVTGKRDANAIWYVRFDRVDAHVTTVYATPPLLAYNEEAIITWEIPQ